jgi:hypothetical protein
MTDNDLIKLFRPIVIDGLSAAGYIDVSVKSSYQPTQQGINNNPTVYFFKSPSKRYGYQAGLSKWNSTTSEMDHLELQQIEASFTVSALVTQNPNITNSYTACDLVQEVALILGSQQTIFTLAQSSVGILRTTEILNPYFIDDKDQYYASPSFTFVLTYLQSRLSTVPVITLPVDLDIYSI